MVGCLVAALFVTDRAIRARTPTTIVTREFKTFQRSYINVYLCALGAEWLQDSHLFALLLRHGHSLSAVASLFAASFSVSYAWGILGSYLPAGGASFLGGRRSACVICFGLYACAATTVFHDDYTTLLVGRFFYGTATALLHTVFDGWLQTEHSAQAFPDDWLVQTYQEVSRYTVVVSVGSGIVAELCAASAGLAAPFVASFALAIFGGFLVSQTWPRQPSDRFDADCGACSDGALGAMAGGLRELIDMGTSAEGRGAIYLVMVQSCFETAMYVVLFMWTPILNDSAVELRGLGVPPPYGLVFAGLMAALMLGSHCFQLASSYATALPCFKPESLASGLCAVAGGACLVLALVGALEHWIGYAALLVFEFCVGE